jgi:P4 family phage/plasmid primase-like protien
MSSLLRNHKLSSFLQEHVSGNKEANFTGMGGEAAGRWSITNEDYPKFYDLLHDYLWVQNGTPINMVERPRKNESKPLMIDIDFHYSLENNKIRKFKKEQVHQFTKHIGETLRKFLKIENYQSLRFFITQRPAPYREGSKPFIKDGIHILCPDIALKNEKQKVIRNYILQEGFLKNSFEGTGYINKDEDVYDESMTRDQAWFPYGESKPSIPPYLLQNVFVYDTINDEWSEEEPANYSNRELMEKLSIHYKISDDTAEVKEHVKEEFNTLLNGRPLPEVEESEMQLPNFQDFLLAPPTEQEKSLIERLVLECLNQDRAEGYESWMRVGWALHNIEKSEEMFNLWMDFSRKSSKFRSNNVAQLKADFFYKMRSDGPRLTERSLHIWAKKDNPELYKKIVDECIYEYIRQEVDGTHYHMAKLIKKIYKNNYVASINNRDTDWYYYDDQMNMWRHLNQGIQLKTKISTEVAGYIAQVQHKFSMRACDERVSKSDREVAVAEVKRFQKMQNCLFTNGFVESTMKMSETVFCDEDFTNKLNKDPYLFACKNGVIQLRVKVEGSNEESVIFRHGIPEDYLSFLAGYNFPEHDAINYVPYDEKNPVYKEIFDFFDKIFPNKELRDYFLRLLASCLEGMNREQCYYTWEGVGGNGKSKIVELMRLTFGDYQTSLQATTLTRKRPESGAANPDIIAIKNRRFIYLQEPDDKEPLNTSRMKQFSGEDMVEARGLYKDQEKFKVSGKLNMMCNSKPIIRTMDRGTWRRIRVIPFESKFVSEDDPEYISKKKNVFLRDNELDNKLVQWREPFLSLLVHIYTTQYLKTGLEPTPSIVKKASEEYKESNDSYAKFENERIRKDEGTKITFRDIERAYKKWVEFSGGSARRLNSQELLKRVNDEYGVPNDGKFYYDRIVFNDDEDVEQFDSAKAESSV